jgi:hypothetical protein
LWGGFDILNPTYQQSNAMQPYQQAILQALYIPRFISTSNAQPDAQVETQVEYPKVSAQLLSDLSLAVNQSLALDQVVFGEQLVVTPTYITLPYPMSGEVKPSVYRALCEHYAVRVQS